MNVKEGQSVTTRRTFNQEDFDRFAALSGDDNPIHVDPAYAAQTSFGRTVCHGMLLYGAISQVLGDKLPGPGTVQLQGEVTFPAPTFAGDEIEVRVEVTKVEAEDGLATLDTTVTRSDGEVTCRGTAVVGLSPSLLGTLQDPAADKEAAGDEEHKQMRLGQQASDVGIFTVFELAEYVDLVGDTNPLYRDAGFAEEVGLTGTIIPGGLIGGMFSKLLGTKLPGPGTAWLKQRLTFLAPAYPGELLTASVRIIRLRPSKDLVNLLTTCTRPDGEVVCSGEALVLVRDM